jgi:hypothetical protein
MGTDDGNELKREKGSEGDEYEGDNERNDSGLGSGSL